jgi:hypothetical protein
MLRQTPERLKAFLNTWHRHRTMPEQEWRYRAAANAANAGIASNPTEPMAVAVFEGAAHAPRSFPDGPTIWTSMVADQEQFFGWLFVLRPSTSTRVPTSHAARIPVPLVPQIQIGTPRDGPVTCASTRI